MKPTLSRFSLWMLAGALLLATAPLRAQDDQQSLGDVAKKNRAAKPKAKVTLDEDNSAPPPPPSTASENSDAAAQSTPNGDQAQGTAPAAPPDSASAQPASAEDKMAALKKDEANLKTVISKLRDRINDEQAADETKAVWRQALNDAQQQLDDNLKQQGSAAPPAPAPKPQQ